MAVVHVDTDVSNAGESTGVGVEGYNRVDAAGVYAEPVKATAKSRGKRTVVDLLVESDMEKPRSKRRRKTVAKANKLDRQR